MATNPYAAPQARVEDAVPSRELEGDFVPEGRALSPGSGWTWISAAWRLFRASPWVWIGIAVVVSIGYGLLSVVPFGQVAFMLIAPAVGAGLLMGCRALDEGGELTFGHLGEGFRVPQTGRLIAVGAIALVATMAMLAAAFGLIWATIGFAAFSQGGGWPTLALLMVLIVLALSVPIYMALWFAPALVVFHDYPPVEALRTSFRACLRNTMPFLVYGIAVAIWTLVALIPVGLGLLVLTPVIIASVYTAYRDIFFTR